MVKRVLVPLDGSSLAEQALPYARLFSDSFQCPLALLRVVNPTPLIVQYGMNSPREDEGPVASVATLARQTEAARKQAADYLGTVEEELRKEEVQVSAKVVEGAPAEAIMEESQLVPETLVVMATHGRSGLTRWLLGSVADRVVNSIMAPVLLVRSRPAAPERADIHVNNLILPLDRSVESEQALPVATTVARAMGLKVTLVTVTPGLGSYLLAESYPNGVSYDAFSGVLEQHREHARNYLERVADRMRQQGVASLEPVVPEGDAGGVIVDLASDTRDSIVVMATHGRSGVRRWVLGSVTGRVVRHSGAPVLVVRAHETAGTQ